MKTLKNIVYSALTAGVMAMTPGCSSLNYNTQMDLTGIARAQPVTESGVIKLETHGDIREGISDKYDNLEYFWFQTGNEEIEVQLPLEGSNKKDSEALMNRLYSLGSNGIPLIIQIPSKFQERIKQGQAIKVLPSQIKP